MSAYVETQFEIINALNIHVQGPLACFTLMRSTWSPGPSRGGGMLEALRTTKVPASSVGSATLAQRPPPLPTLLLPLLGRRRVWAVPGRLEDGAGCPERNAREAEAP